MPTARIPLIRTCQQQPEADARFVWLVLTALLVLPFGAGASEEEAFPLLQIGTQTYTNVTVTTKAKSYIFIVHSGGMSSIKVADLPLEAREKLGYASAEKPKLSTNGPASWARTQVARLETPQMKEVQQNLRKRWQAASAHRPTVLALTSNTVFLAILGTLALLYALQSYCFMLICRKAGHPPGLLAWLPVLQFYPLIRAAGMSGWWFLAHLLPFLNLVAFVVWSVKITQARGKSAWVALFLILPPTTVPAVLYLAFSGGSDSRRESKQPEIMSLQTA